MIIIKFYCFDRIEFKLTTYAQSSINDSNFVISAININ